MTNEELTQRYNDLVHLLTAVVHKCGGRVVLTELDIESAKDHVLNMQTREENHFFVERVVTTRRKPR